MSSPGGIKLDARGLTRVTKGGERILSEVSLSIRSHELIAVVGGSGAGKSTLLDTLAGIASPTEGRVTFDGADLHENLAAFRPIIGYVPQEDIIHLELPLARTLHYAAALRMPTSTTTVQVEAAVDRSLKALDLADRSNTPVGLLSGGQRKRASIAVELLTDPRVFFLDEPTSGLDPATSASLLTILRRLADSGTTVIFTTHAIQDLASCDRTVFLAPGGHLSFVGSIPAALDHFGVAAVEDIYRHLAASEPAFVPFQPGSTPPPDPAPPPDAPPKPGMLRQLGILTSRTVETLVRNKLTLAILIGSPAMVIALFVILFRPGAFDLSGLQPTAILMIIFWITFGSFFFGLTYGLLQIVVERPVLRREYLAGLDLTAYLLSKVVVMLPFLAAVNVSMLVVLRLLDRLPADDVATYVSLAVTLTLTAAAALTLGLAASAAVDDASQATLALPMLCFPAVLFSGAILPVHIMATVGRWIAAAVPSRWGFEAIGHDLGVRELMAEGGSALGPPLLETYGEAGLRATGTYWAILLGFAVGFFLLTRFVLARKVARGRG